MINTRMYEDLLALGLQAEDTVLMHSSLSSLGYVEGGAQTVIDTLLALLHRGTLLLPALTFRPVYETKVFSSKDTPSCVGAISEHFRCREGVMRSFHPTHSVCAAGKYAVELLQDHFDSDTPAGPNSPFARLPAYDGKILMLGCSIGSNTSMHAVEETMDPWYLFMDRPVTYTMYDDDGRCFQKAIKRHNFVGNGLRQRYDRLANVMQIPQGKVLQATGHLIPAAEMWRIAQKTMALDTNYFVEKINEERVAK